MTANTDALIQSIQGGPILDPKDLAAAFVDAANSSRLGDVRGAMDTKPGPRIPPRYESEVRTWLARALIEDDAAYSRLQAYAAVHLDPNNRDALAALDDACKSLGDDVREGTWSALVHSYPDVKALRHVVDGVGIPLPDPDLQRQAAKKAAAKKRKRRADEPLIVELPDGSGDPGMSPTGTDRKKGPKARAEGLATLVPALEPDTTVADRLGVVHLAAGAEWTLPGGGDDVLSVAVRRMAGEDIEIPEHASGISTWVSLERREGTEARGPRYGRLLRRVKNHPAVVAWAVRSQLSDGDAIGARLARERVPAIPAVWKECFAELDRLLSIAGGDLEAGWEAWKAGKLPDPLRPPLARALHEAERDRDADEVLGLPDISADEMDDPVLLAVRFDLLFLDGDLEGSLVQARRAALLEMTPDTISRLWLGLAANACFVELADRIADDAEAVGLTPVEIVARVRPTQEKRVRVILGPVRELVGEARAALQELAKGRTIRDEDAFAAAVEVARGRLESLGSLTALLAIPEPGGHPVSVEDLVSFLAAGAGMRVRVAAGEVVVDPPSSPRLEPDPSVGKLFLEPARTLVERGDDARALVARAMQNLDFATDEGKRTDVPRRRLEERVARHARLSAECLSLLLSVLDPFSPSPDITSMTEGDGRAPDDGTPGEPLEDVAPPAIPEDSQARIGPEADAEPEGVATVTGPALGEEGEAAAGPTDGNDEPGEEDPGAGRWFRRRR